MKTTKAFLSTLLASNLLLAAGILPLAAPSLALQDDEPTHEDTHEHNEHETEEHEDDKDHHSDESDEQNSKDRQKHHQDENSHDENSDNTTITQAMATASGIRTQTAGAETIQHTLSVYGRLIPHPDRLARVSARFPGLVTSVDASPGDQVKAGMRLARIEADQSLNTYALTSPIAGTVIDRNISLGEYARTEPLFSVADLSVLQAELKLFPRQMANVQQGQRVNIVSGDNDQLILSQVDYLLPAQDKAPFIHAFASIDNRTGKLGLGQLVQARIVIEQVEVSVAVENDALQSMEGTTVIFIRQGDNYKVRQVSLGRRDERHTEITNGLAAGEEYVSDNSYLIKADLEKSGAGHSH
ncbi:MAG: efflux RND transporter periplasmic adaptor subunit [Parahaliea sp.]